MAQINLLQGQQGAGKKKKIPGSGGTGKALDPAAGRGLKFDFDFKNLTKNLSRWFYQISLGVIVLMVLIAVWFFYYQFSLEKQLSSARSKEMVFASSPKELKDLQDNKKNLEDALQVLKDILENKTLLSPILNFLSNDVPDGVWFEQITFLKQPAGKDKEIRVFNLKIKGSVYSPVAGNEIDILEKFTRVLKADTAFSDLISNIKFGTVSKGIIAKQEITNFDMEIILK